MRKPQRTLRPLTRHEARREVQALAECLNADYSPVKSVVVTFTDAETIVFQSKEKAK